MNKIIAKLLLKWFLDSTFILTSKDLNASFCLHGLFYIGECSRKIGKSSFFRNCVWVLANPILNLVGKNSRFSRGDLMFLTLDLLPSETEQIYSRGKPQSFPTVCSSHSFLELLAPPVGWLSCCLAPLACVLLYWGNEEWVPAHLVMWHSASTWGSQRKRRGAESWKWELPPLSQGGQSSFVGQSTQCQGAGTAVICLRQL